MQQEKAILMLMGAATLGSYLYFSHDSRDAIIKALAPGTASTSACGDCRAASPAAVGPADGATGSSATDVAETTSSSTPGEVTYRGKIEDLPDAGKDVLRFTPADSPDETNSESIRDRVEHDCGLSDYVGSDDYPGSVTVSPPREHGWVRVVWKLGKCKGIAGSSYPNPTLKFEISQDYQHINYLEGGVGAAYVLTH